MQGSNQPFPRVCDITASAPSTFGCRMPVDFRGAPRSDTNRVPIAATAKNADNVRRPLKQIPFGPSREAMRK